MDSTEKYTDKAEEAAEEETTAEENAEVAQSEEAQETEAAEEISEDQEGENAEGSDEDSSEDDSMKEKYLRLMADFQNFKKRSQKEKSDIRAFANEKIVTELLQVMDNFERAMEHDPGDGFKEGIALIFDQLKVVLEHAGVEEIEAENVQFDPTVHNAVMMEDTDEVESGKVSTVLQKGYKLNGRVIRASMVKVAN